MTVSESYIKYNFFAKREHPLKWVYQDSNRRKQNFLAQKIYLKFLKFLETSSIAKWTPDTFKWYSTVWFKYLPFLFDLNFESPFTGPYQ